MKKTHSLFLATTLLLSTPSFAQVVNGSIQVPGGRVDVHVNNGPGRDDGRRDDRRDDRNMAANQQVAPTQQAQAIFDFQNSLRNFSKSIEREQGFQQLRGSTQSLEQSAQLIATLLMQPNTAAIIQIQVSQIDVITGQMASTILAARFANQNILQSFYALAKAVGEVQIALDPRFSAPVVILPPAPPPVVIPTEKYAKCSVTFKNSWDQVFTTSSESFDIPNAMRELNQACARVAGTAPGSSTPNSNVCQSNLDKATCVDAYEEGRRMGPTPNGFYSIKMPFKNSWDQAFSPVGTGMSATEALMGLWDQCKSIAGTAPGSSIPNSQVCASNFTMKRYISNAGPR